jgi:hypothetical protein
MPEKMRTVSEFYRRPDALQGWGSRSHDEYEGRTKRIHYLAIEEAAQAMLQAVGIEVEEQPQPAA